MTTLEKILREIEKKIKKKEECFDSLEKKHLLNPPDKYDYYIWYEGMKDAKNIIKKHLQSCEDNKALAGDNDWVTVEERLPKTNGVYNVTRFTEGHYISDIAYFDGQDTWHNDNRVNHNRNYLKDVVYWRPLPEPYKPAPESADGKRQREREEFFTEYQVGYRDGKEKNDWIPVEEGLPKKSGIYLVSCDDNEFPVKRMRYDKRVKPNGLFYCINGIYDGEIFAWRPLPEPYKPDQESSDAKRQRDTEEFFTEYQEGE